MGGTVPSSHAAHPILSLWTLPFWQLSLTVPSWQQQIWVGPSRLHMLLTLFFLFGPYLSGSCLSLSHPNSSRYGWGPSRLHMLLTLFFLFGPYLSGSCLSLSHPDSSRYGWDRPVYTHRCHTAGYHMGGSRSHTAILNKEEVSRLLEWNC